MVATSVKDYDGSASQDGEKLASRPYTTLILAHLEINASERGNSMAVKPRTNEAARIAEGYAIEELFGTEGERRSEALKLVAPGHIKVLKQVRSEIDSHELDDLSESISETRKAGGGIEGTGIEQALVVRVDPQAKPGVASYILIAGERRLQAARRLGLDYVPVTVRGVDEVQAAIIQLTENLQRVDVKPIDEARGFQNLRTLGWSLKDISHRIGKSQTFVNNRLALLKMPPDVQRMAERRPDTVAIAPQVAKLPEVKRREVILGITENNDSFKVANTKIQKALDLGHTARPPALLHSERREDIQSELRRASSELADTARGLGGTRDKLGKLIVNGGELGELYRRDLRENAGVIKAQIERMRLTLRNIETAVDGILYDADA